MSTPLPAPFPAVEKTYIDKVIGERVGRAGALLGILEEVQKRNPHQYLPLDTLRYIATRTETPLSRIYSVATFYALFNLQPQGENTICICRGTACHTRGSRGLLERLRLDLKLGGEDGSDESDSDKLQLTTSNRKFTVRTVEIGRASCR